MGFPDNCLRGIPSVKQIEEDGGVSTTLFLFDDNHKKSTGELTQSINWEDDDLAIRFTLAQTKNGVPQFEGGVAVIPRKNIEAISSFGAIRGALTYDRQVVPGNAYHGNLVLAPTVSKRLRKLIAGNLATAVTRIVPHIQSDSGAM